MATQIMQRSKCHHHLLTLGHDHIGRASGATEASSIEVEMRTCCLDLHPVVTDIVVGVDGEVFEELQVKLVIARSLTIEKWSYKVSGIYKKNDF